MTDRTPWQPPASPPPAESAQQSPFAPAPGVTTAPAPGWTPPPRPGLIPLRPLTVGVLLGAAFQVLRRNPRPTFGFSLLIIGTVSLLSLAAVGLVTYLAFARTANATGADAQTLTAGSIALGVLAGLVSVGFSIVASAVLQGVISLEVARGTVGEKLRLGGLWRAARGRIGALIGWTLLVLGAVVITLGLIATVIALMVAFGGVAGVVVGVLLGVAAGIGGAIVAVWLGTKLSLVPSVLMLERLTLRAAVARSWSLTRGFFWRAFGIQLLVIVIIQTVSAVITAPIQLLVGFGATLINPGGGSDGFLVVAIIVYVLTLVITIVFGAIAAVVQSATPALIYIDIRMRKEALDLELAQYVEARISGDESIADPYLVRAGGSTTPPAAAPSPLS